MPKVSIIVPCYKAEQYLGGCVKSIRRQTLADIEIILVDDGSPDRVPQMCDHYAAKDTRIKVIHKENAGVGAARNDGFAASSGDYVLFCDSDDFLESDACEKLYRAAENADADVALGDVYRVYGAKRRYARFFAEPFTADDRDTLDDLVRADFSRKFCRNAPPEGPAFGYGGPWNKLVRRAFLAENGIGFDTSLKGIFDDILFTAYLYAAAKRVVYIPEPVYNYRILEGSVTHSFKPDIPEINRAIFAAWDTFLKRFGADGRFDEAYDALVIRRLKGMLGTYFFSAENPADQRAQKAELKKVLDEEPYRMAIRRVSPRHLINAYDQAVWAMARLHSAEGIYLVYRAFCLVKKSS